MLYNDDSNANIPDRTSSTGAGVIFLPGDGEIVAQHYGHHRRSKALPEAPSLQKLCH